MSESNKTHSDQTHRIFISSPKRTSDHTGLYILILLCFLSFILIFYLVYNFISYKRYSATRKKNKIRNNLYLSSQKPLSTGIKPKSHADLYKIPLQTSLLVSDL